ARPARACVRSRSPPRPGPRPALRPRTAGAGASRGSAARRPRRRSPPRAACPRTPRACGWNGRSSRACPWTQPAIGGVDKMPTRPRAGRRRAPDTISGCNPTRPLPMSSAFGTATVLDARHWTARYFSFATTRDVGSRLEHGQLVTIGVAAVSRPLMRAYSIASATWEEQLEFFSIKVPAGPLTSRLQHVRPGDTLLIGRKPTGTLLIHDLHPGRNLYLLGTGTGL